jgi:hypothetical protein
VARIKTEPEAPQVLVKSYWVASAMSDGMKPHVFITLNRVVIDEAVKHPLSMLLFKNLLLFGIGNL